MRARWGVALLVSLGLVLFSFPFAQAQKTTGTITGIVSDPTGAVLPGATVKVTNLGTGGSRVSTTNSQGSFTFPELSAGMYSVTVNASGFKQVVQQNVELHVADITPLNVRMEVGTPTETINVETSPVAVETQSGEVSNVMLGNQVRELPLNGRNFVQLTTLVPGAAVGENFDAKNKGLLAGVDISFSGAPSNANQWTVDGANNNDIGSQRTILIYPSVDGIEEFKILRNSYGPEYGGAGGAQINIVTRGGTNAFHGDAYYFGRNDVLNAKNYFLGQCDPSNPITCRKQMLRRNDWGYTFGGPLKKDKVFFFWSEEWNRERRGVVRQAQVPTSQERSGDFSDCGGPVLGASGLSPGGQLYASQTPLPNTPDPCAAVNWVAPVNIPLNWREENIRGDWNITNHNTIMLRFAQDTWVNPTHAYEEGGLWGDQAFPAVSDTWQQPGKQAVVKLTTTIGTQSVNDFQFSWSANRIHILRAGDNPALNKQIVAAMPTVFDPAGKLHAGDLPEPICWCSTYFGILSPWDNRQDLYTWKDDFSKVTGKHTFKLGMLYDRNAKDEEGGEEATGLWGATGMYNDNWGATDSSAHGFYVNLLTKGMLWGANENARNIISTIRWRDYEPYAGDSWKATRRLTLDYGLRWQIIQPEFMDDNHISGFLPSLFNPALGNDPCNGVLLAKGAPNLCTDLGSTAGTYSKYRSLVPTNKHNFAPRLGFAWDVFGTARFVLRGGAGQFFARDPVGISIRMEQSNPPFGIGAAGEHTLDDCATATGGLSTCTGAFSSGVNLFDWATGGFAAQGMENNANVSNSWQWNITTETALGRDSKLELGWVALRGIHLESAHDVNQIRPENRLQYILRGFPCTVERPTNCGQDAGGRKDLYPYGHLTTNQITIWDHQGDSIYHSLQAMFSSRWGKSSIFQSSYTWSKNISTTTLGYIGTSTVRSDTYNDRINRGLADFDRRHVFNASLVYNLPELQGQNGFLRGVAGSWETSTVVNLASGPQLSINGNANNVVVGHDPKDPTKLLTAGFNPWGVANAGQFGARPNRSGASCFTDNRLQFINPGAFSYNDFVLGGYPNTGPNQCSGPGTADVDLAVAKNWNLPWHGGKFFGETARVQFRLETFNLFNHPMFRFNNTNLSFQSDGGQIVNGVIQGSTLQSGSQFGHTPLASTIGNREIQYALKVIW
jgi:carboxypeptidase family protein